MSAVGIASIVMICVFGGALGGMLLRTILPEHHISGDSRDVIKLGMGLTATMSALVLALLIASAKGSFDIQRTELTQVSTDVVLLDRFLAQYGPETAPARLMLHSLAVGMVAQIWPVGHAAAALTQPLNRSGDAFFDSIQALSPSNDAQRRLQEQALKLSIDLGQLRWMLFEQTSNSIPMPFLILMIFWVTTIFISFGMFAPPNPTVIAVLFLCALSISGAIFLILEMDHPYTGLVRLSEAPMLSAIAHLGH